MVEIIKNGITVAKLNNGAVIDIYGNVTINGCFGVNRVPAKLHIE